VILTKGELFDYEAKYSEGGCLEVTPAKVSDEVLKQIQDLALRVHKVCGCKDISRTDMIMNEDGELVVLEINTVPGMTKTSFIPAELAASGYTIGDFVRGMLRKYS
jgi:D-alanine-D-alanine ligase